MSTFLPHRAEGAVSRDMDDGHTVILAADGSCALVLNPTAAVVWELCDGSRTVEGIAEFISANSREANPERVAQDVESIVSQLREQGLIEHSG